MITIIQTKISSIRLKYIEEKCKQLLTKDFSNYAKGRLRVWIGCEAPLTDSQKFKKCELDYKSNMWTWLYGFCKEKLNFEPEIALMHLGGADCSNPEEQPKDGRGGECGILEHRDAGYADYCAVGINITGNAIFGYKNCYKTQDCWAKEQDMNAPIQLVKMTQGTCVKFNCKNPHFAQCGPNRWCINAWKISKKRRKEFETFMG